MMTPQSLPILDSSKKNLEYEKKFKDELPIILLAKSANKEALEWLARNSLSMRQQVARYYLPYLPDQWPDAENVGWIGILDALEKWKEKMQIRFFDYAIYHVKNRVRNYANSCRTTVRRPNSAYREYRKIEKYLEQGLTLEEIANLHGYSTHHLEKILQVYTADISLHFTSLDEPESCPLDFIVYPENDEDFLEKEERLRKLYIALSHLDEISRKVVLYFFGIEEELGAQKKSTAWIAHKLGISRKKVVQLLENSLKQLKRDFFLLETFNIQHPLPIGLSTSVIQIDWAQEIEDE
ncbi:hypothetical protein A7Q10_02365 [Methylacidiphilum caldifontis]|uniref:RNA polymerase subunit sigma-70 n=2 Tax=Methylacidiphilum caldifontis TaxID=2795386 RepID=A0A4Y8P7B3_9BACT|nr:hypothetical protein A7Q10_02365 [Methylacidiphilum caldifontis]